MDELMQLASMIHSSTLSRTNGQQEPAHARRVRSINNVARPRRGLIEGETGTGKSSGAGDPPVVRRPPQGELVR